MQQAYLIGLAGYPNYRLAGGPNDLALMRCALLHQECAPDGIQTFGDGADAKAGLRQILAAIAMTLPRLSVRSTATVFSISVVAACSRLTRCKEVPIHSTV